MTGGCEFYEAGMSADCGRPAVGSVRAPADPDGYRPGRAVEWLYCDLHPRRLRAMLGLPQPRAVRGSRAVRPVVEVAA